MKKIILQLLIFLTKYSFGQSVISSVNSGATSANNLVYSVGEIYVMPTTNPNEANSGLIAALSRIEFFVTGFDDKLFSDDTRVYPNPTSHSLYFISSNSSAVNQVFIFDNNGRLVSSKKLFDYKVDMGDMQKGVYFIKTIIESIQSFKIIKQ